MVGEGTPRVVESAGAAGCASMDEDVQVMTMDDGDFDGDTVLAIPGGRSWSSSAMEKCRGGMEEAGENVWVEKEANGAEVIVRKRVVVTTDGQR